MPYIEKKSESEFETSSNELFFTSCKVIEFLINSLGINKSTNHYIRNAVRLASLNAAGKTFTGKHMARWISPKAIEVQNRGPKSGELILEHSIPVNVIVESVHKLRAPTYLDIANVIYSMSALAVITKDEDRQISQIKLGRSMPKDWDGNDKFIRYKIAGIELVENPF